MDADFLIPLGMFAMVVAIVWLVMHFSAKTRSGILDVVKEAARNGQTMTPETIRALGMPRKSGRGDLKAGAIMLAIAAAVITLGIAIDLTTPLDDSDGRVAGIMIAVASFPGFIGLVLVAFGWVGRDKTDAA